MKWIFSIFLFITCHFSLFALTPVGINNLHCAYTRYYWKICAWENETHFYSSDISYFETGVLDECNWKGSWITDTHNIHLKPAAYFRKVFDTKHKIKEARAYIAVAAYGIACVFPTPQP